MKILIVTDAWPPQINGVVRTLQHSIKELESQGDEIIVIHPYLEEFHRRPLPTYSEIEIVIDPWRVGKLIEAAKPDAIHVSTDGPLGFMASRWCRRRNIPFTSSYHTKLPEYITARFPFIPISWGYRYMRQLHKGSRVVLTTTPSMKEELEAWNLHSNIQVWTRGVDYDVFNSKQREADDNRVLLYVGRVAVEKNLEAFLSLDPDERLGEKVVVGDGPDRQLLEEKYPDTVFVGYKEGEDLAWWYANADVFVFPSKTDTFGIVMIEANACGTPVAAYPVTGPKDFVVNGVNGFVADNLEAAIRASLELPRKEIERYCHQNYSWEKTAEILRNTLVPISTRWH